MSAEPVAYLEPPPEDFDEPTPPAPIDHSAERAVLGACLLSRPAITDSLDAGLRPDGSDFADQRHGTIWAAILHLYARNQVKPDPITVADRLSNTKDLRRVGGQAYLHQLVQAVPTSANAGYYAEIVTETSARRRLDAAGTAIRALAATPADERPTSLLHAAQSLIDDVRKALPALDGTAYPGEDIDTFLQGEDDLYDWLIPGVLERQDRLIVTAGEGHGKSTLLRQIGLQAAAGIHPFTGDKITPLRVLIVDLENTKRQVRRKLRPLRHQAGALLDPNRLIIECHVEGIDLNQAADRDWLERTVAHHQPNILITGPIYKLAGGNPNAEEETKPVAYALDHLRATYDLAVILEAHLKKADGVNPKHRPKTPVGWSGWMRWPEFGIHLTEEGELTHWRGPRDERDFPENLRRGGEWPWTPVTNIEDQEWVKVRNHIRATRQKVTVRQVADLISKSTGYCSGFLGRHSADLAILYRELEEED